jgi:hypothetical protein
MQRLELFVLGCNAGRWRYRLWRNSLFTVTILPEDHDTEPYDINYTPEGVVYFDPTTSSWQPVEDAVADTPLYNNRELTRFPAGSVPNHSEPIDTTYGRMLFNHMVICYAFGAKVPFQHKIKPYDVINLIVRDVVDEDTVVPEGQVVYRPSELQRYIQALFELASLCSYITPTGSEKTLTTHPDMIATRKRLFEENKDRLHDPAVITEIQNKLIALDKEWLKDDNAMDYYIDSKSFTVKRKKMFVMTGIEDAFEEGNKFALVEKSLAEGWDMSQLPASFNSIRQGSFDRGHDTALGGEKVTFLQRIYQNTKIIPGDCGTKLVDRRLLTKFNYRTYMGMNIMVNGAPVELTTDNIQQYIGKVVALRRPILCQAPMTDFCTVCTTRALAKNPRAIAAEISAVGSGIMLAFMSSMHGNELAVSHYDFNNALS